ncbi:MAG: SPOR domain-containing protein [Bacteroidota bacterium]
MDVGFYLGELLMQQGEVSVPGLGYFVQVRVSGYYNEEERKFYPPYHQAQFDVQSIDDDALAEYIANKKNISVASARYFCEKYITNLKQQAAISEVQLGNLGWFYTELSHLTFRPADKIADDTIFYGFEPISINKANDVRQVEERPKVELNFPPRLTHTPPPVPESPKVEEPVFTESNVGTFETTLPGQSSVEDPEAATQFTNSNNYQPVEAGISNEFFEPGDEEEEEQRRSPLLLIMVIVLFIVFIGLAVFALYRFKPDTFAKLTFWKKETKDTIAVKPKENTISKVDTVAPDTTVFLDSATSAVDTIVSTPAVATKTEVINQPTAVPARATKTTTVVTQPAANKTVVVTQPEAKTKVIAPPAKTTVIKQPAVTKTTIVTPPKSAASINIVPAQPTTASVAKTESTKNRASDATGTRRFEVFVSPACNDMAEANRLIAKLKKKGLDPRMVTDAPGPKIHISIGHFKTAVEAKAFAVKSQESGKVAGDAYPLEIIP